MAHWSYFLLCHKTSKLLCYDSLIVFICLIVKQHPIEVTSEKHSSESQLLFVTLVSPVIYFLWDSFLIGKIGRIALGQMIIDTLAFKRGICFAVSLNTAFIYAV